MEDGADSGRDGFAGPRLSVPQCCLSLAKAWQCWPGRSRARVGGSGERVQNATSANRRRARLKSWCDSCRRRNCV